MAIPTLGTASHAAFVVEGEAGTRQAIVGGAASDEFLDLVSESIDYKPVLNRLRPLVGTRISHGDFEFVSHHDGGGGLVCRPRHGQMAALMHLILGPVAAGHYYPVASDVDLPTFTLEVLKASMIEIALAGCKVNTATFRSAGNEPLTLELDIVGGSGERNPGDLTALNVTILAAEKPFMHGLLTPTFTTEAWLGGATPEPIRSVEIVLNNNLDAESYGNSVNRNVIPVGIFELTGTMEVPFNSTTKAFWTEMINATEVTFSLQWADPDAATLTFTITAKLDGDLPDIGDVDPQWLTVNFHGTYTVTNARAIDVEVSA